MEAIKTYQILNLYLILTYMRRILLLVTFILQSFTLLAQYSVKGVVTDSVGAPVESAVVVLMNPENGVAVQQGITACNGEYN